MIVQSVKRSVIAKLFITINKTTNVDKITALLCLTYFSSDLLRIFLSNFETILLIPLAMSSPMDFNASNVMGIPSKQTKIEDAQYLAS